MCVKVAGAVLVVAMLAVVVSKTNEAGEGQAETGDRDSKGAARSAADSGEAQPNPDSVDEIRRLIAGVRDMKQLVAGQLQSLQGLIVARSVIVLGGKETGDGLTWYFPGRMSREEEEWIVLAGELRAENCVEFLLNRISDRSHVNIPNLRRRPYQGCPAFDSLCQIGLPACPSALHRIPLESNGLIRAYLTGVLQRCRGNTEAKSRLIAFKEICTPQEMRKRVQVQVANKEEFWGKCTTQEMQKRVQEAIEQCEAAPFPDIPTLSRYYHAKLKEQHSEPLETNE